MNVNCRFRTSLQVIAFLAILTNLCDCRKRPALIDTLGTAIDYQPRNYRSDPRQLAPIIVIASVQENSIVVRHIGAARYPDVYLDLHRVRCKRENALKGDTAGPELWFFYFADGRYPDSKPNPRYKRLFEALPGFRYLFFLTRERSVLRSIGDVGDYSILVSSGAHPQDPMTDSNVGNSIAKILLSPGRGANLDQMAKGLLAYSSVVDDWASRLVAVQLLRNLTAFPEPVGSQACGVLVAKYLAQDDCLQAILQNPSEPAGIREEATRELKQQNAFRPRLLESLRDPAALTYLDAAGDSRRRIREEFETMLYSSDAVLHKRVCAALKRYFPYDAEPGCSK